MKIEVHKLTKKFTSTVVDEVSFVVNNGEFVSLLGPSGCGKTTILRMIAGLEAPTSGAIKLGDSILFQKHGDRTVILPAHKREIGMVFQSYALWPHRTVGENVSFPLEIQRVAKSDRREKINEALELVAMAELKDRYPHELSGGQQQRVALARAIAQKPKVMLLDEPLSNLDAKLREQMRKELKQLQEKLKLTMIYVTHDRLEALELSHRMAILDHGKLVQMDTPEAIRKNPANEFVSHFIAY